MKTLHRGKRRCFLTSAGCFVPGIRRQVRQRSRNRYFAARLGEADHIWDESDDMGWKISYY